MSIIRALLPLLILALATVPSMANEVQIRPENVISVITADWNDDGVFDRAVLALSDEAHDDTVLFIYLSDKTTDKLVLVVRKANVVTAGSMGGPLPRLELTDRGSLLIHDENSSIGRNRWKSTLTVAHRNGAFVVAGYTYSGRDTLELEAETACDLNLLTGKGVVNGEERTFAPMATPLADWDGVKVTTLCQ